MTSFRTERGLDRLVNFSDAAVAIAITLLVLPLVDVAGQITSMSLGRLFETHGGTFLAFALSFVVIARFWVVHHRVFEFVIDYSSAIVWANFLWLLSIVFLPFVTNVLANAQPNNGAVYAVYIITLIVTSGSMLLIEALLKRRPSLLRPESADGLNLLPSTVAICIFVVALVLAVLFPTIGMLWLLLFALSTPIMRLVKRIRRNRDRDGSSTRRSGGTSGRDSGVGGDGGSAASS